MASHHPILGNLETQFHYYLPCNNNLDVIKAFQAEGIDLRIFSTSDCTSVECLLFFLENDYPFNVNGLKRLIGGFINGNNSSSIDHVVEIIIEKFKRPDDTFFYLNMHPYGEYFVPYLNISSEKLIGALMGSNCYSPRLCYFKHCNPEDYLTTKFFKFLVSRGAADIIKLLVENGYDFKQEDLYDNKCDVDFMKSCECLRLLDLWSGETFDWSKIKRDDLYYSKKYYLFFYTWLESNCCPAEFMDSLFFEDP
jgi:hypothetical protein